MKENEMFVVMDEPKTSRKNELENYPGLIMCSDSCRCELHGFEIDMDGKIIMPVLNPSQDQDCKILGKHATES